MTERELGVYTRAKDPSVMFIAETWVDEARLKIVKRRLKFDHMFSVPRVNKGGGLVLFWKESMNWRVETSSKNHIDCIVGGGTDGLKSKKSSLTKYGHMLDEAKEIAD